MVNMEDPRGKNGPPAEKGIDGELPNKPSDSTIIKRVAKALAALSESDQALGGLILTSRYLLPGSSDISDNAAAQELFTGYEPNDMQAIVAALSDPPGDELSRVAGELGISPEEAEKLEADALRALRGHRG